jgi:hypothetical protein
VSVRDPADVAISPAVITDILREPDALGSTLTTAVALVAELTVTELTVIPGPKLAAETLCAK